MAEPPLLVGAVQETKTAVSRGVPVTLVGAPGTTALTVKEFVTGDAGRKATAPA